MDDLYSSGGPIERIQYGALAQNLDEGRFASIEMLAPEECEDVELLGSDLTLDTEREKQVDDQREQGRIHHLEAEYMSEKPTRNEDFEEGYALGMVGDVELSMTKQSRELTDESNTIRIDQLWASTAQRVSDSDGPKPFNSSEIEDTNSATNKKRPKPSTKNISVGNALKIRQWNPEYQREATNIPSSAWEQYRDTISHWHNHGFTKQMIREQLNFLGFNATTNQLIRRMRLWNLLDVKRPEATSTAMEAKQKDLTRIDPSNIDYDDSQAFSRTSEPAYLPVGIMSLNTLETDIGDDREQGMIISTQDGSTKQVGQEQQHIPKEPSLELPRLQRKTSSTLPGESNFDDNISVISASSANSEPYRWGADLIVETQRGSTETLSSRLDTGANHNMIFESAFKGLASTHELEPSHETVHGISGIVNIIGWIKLNFYLQGLHGTRHGPYRARFHVVEGQPPDRSYDALLGANFVLRQLSRPRSTFLDEHFGDLTGNLSHYPLPEANANLQSTLALPTLVAKSGKDNQAAGKQWQEQEQDIKPEVSGNNFEMAVSFMPESLPGLTEGTTAEPVSVVQNSNGGAPVHGHPSFELSFENSQSRVFFWEESDLLHKRFDSRSVVSNDDDVASQASLERPARNMWAEDYLASFLVEDEDIEALCKEAFSGIERDCLRRNLRRLLKSFYISLVKRAKNDVEKHAIALLRRRVSRERIAASMISSLDASTEEKRLQLEGENQAAKVRVHAWLKGMQSGAMINGPHATSIHGTNLADSSSDSESEPEGIIAGPLNVALLEQFMKSGDPICQFRARLQAFLLPTSLASIARILLAVPSDRVTFLDGYQQSLSDRVKCHLEKVSGAQWNWWPFSQSHPCIQPGQVRIRYQCHCENSLWHDVSVPEAEHLRSLVRMRGKSVRGELFSSMKRESALSPSSLAILQTRTPKHVPNAGNASSTSAQHLRSPSPVYQRQGMIDQNKQSLGQTGQPRPNSNSSTASQQGSKSTISISLLPRFYILLGAKRERRNLEIGHLDTTKAYDDGTLLLNLKAEYRRLRGPFRSWFSIWQLSHCEFVKFHKRFHNLGVFSKGYDLPTDIEYTYDPRKPNAEDPPITAHEFREALSTCSASCLFRHCAFAHRCQPESRTQTMLKLIPKKCSLWDFKAMKPDNEMAWGLEACHEISALLVVIYHIILLSIPYGFWAYWQGVHPKDMQNASIPTTVAVSMITLFWTLSGIIQVLREPLSSNR